ncbi:MAG TPA: class I SAM-dependent methyltransferase [Pseudonocardiaceae bacterium]|nr:class I SAM-dependent methyltransferase [Pseudonocardiaceae bacterium]
MAEVLAPVSRDRQVLLRAGFDRVAALYDRSRPGYPSVMFDDLAELAGIGPDCRVLEIGCGTGHATLPLAQRGCHVLAVELGARLAAVASARLADFPYVRIEVADFDRWTTDEPAFDVVFAATAFHWLDPASRYDRVADLLRPGGFLAVAGNEHIAGGTEQFFVDVQACYRRYDPTTPPGQLLQPADAIPFDRALGERYEQPVFRRHEWNVDYRTAEYLDLLRTYSPTLALPTLARDGFLRAVGALIDSRYGGRITKRYLTELRVARVAAPGAYRPTP